MAYNPYSRLYPCYQGILARPYPHWRYTWHWFRHNFRVYPCFESDGRVFRPYRLKSLTFRRLPLVLYVCSYRDFRVINCLNRLNKGFNSIRTELQH